MPSFLLARNKTAEFKYKDDTNMNLILPVELLEKPISIDDELVYGRMRDF